MSADEQLAEAYVKTKYPTGTPYSWVSTELRAAFLAGLIAARTMTESKLDQKPPAKGDTFSCERCGLQLACVQECTIDKPCAMLVCPRCGTPMPNDAT